MMKLGDLVGQKLKWVQPRPFKLEYELQVGDKVAATLRYPRFFDTFAIAESADGTWTFKGGDFWQPNVIIRAIGVDTDLAVFKNNIVTGHGILELPGGHKYWWTHIMRWLEYKYRLKTESNEWLVTYQNIWEFWWYMSADVLIHSRAKQLAEELPWIVILGWHMVLVL